MRSLVTALSFSLVSTVATSATAADISCLAIHEFQNSRQQLEHQEKPLKTTFSSAGLISMETDLDNHNFSLRGDPNGEEFLAIISQGPSYTKGLTANGSFNSTGQLRVAIIDGLTVHKLVCQR